MDSAAFKIVTGALLAKHSQGLKRSVAKCVAKSVANLVVKRAIIGIARPAPINGVNHHQHEDGDHYQQPFV
jgi:hypothetical protein